MSAFFLGLPINLHDHHPASLDLFLSLEFGFMFSFRSCQKNRVLLLMICVSRSKGACIVVCLLM